MAALFVLLMQATAELAGSVSVDITAIDEGSGVAWVEFWMDQTVIQRWTSPPYALSWNTRTAMDGAHNLFAKAADNAGNVGTSNILPVLIRNAQPVDTIAPSVTLSLGALLTVFPASAKAQTTVSVQWTGILIPTPRDWFAFYAAGANDTAYLDWAYVSCTRIPTVGRTSGSCAFTIPTVPADPYELRLFSNNGFVRLSTAAFAVTP